MNISNQNKLTVTGRESYWCQTGPKDLVENLAYEQHPICRDPWGGMIDDIHTFSPTFVGDLRLGPNRYDQYSFQPSLGYDPTKLGFPSYIAANSPHLMMPLITFSDGYGGNAATSCCNINQPYSTYQIFNRFTKVIGTHTVKFGGRALLQDFTDLNWLNSTGGYTFDAGSYYDSLNIKVQKRLSKGTSVRCELRPFPPDRTRQLFERRVLRPGKACVYV